MKKWMFVIFPGIMLILFLVYYRQQMTALDERDARRATEVARQKADASAHKKAIEDQARAESEKRAAEAAAETAKQEADREAKWNAEGKDLQDKTDHYNSESARYAQRAQELQDELKRLDEQKETDNRADFDLLKDVEATRVAQHNAEMEIQRMVAMIVNRADESSLTEMPPPPPPPTKR